MDKARLNELMGMTNKSKMLENVETHSEDLIIYAVTSEPQNIRYVKEPTITMCRLALGHGGVEVFDYINRKDEEYLFEVVKIQPACIHKIIADDTISDELKQRLCLVAVMNNAFILSMIPYRTPEICLAAVTNKGAALKFIEDQTEEMCLVAVRNDGCALKYVNKQTDEICLEAVKKSGMALEYVENQTPEIVGVALEETYYALEYIKDQTEEHCLLAIKQDAFAISYVKEENLTRKVLECAIIKDPDSIFWFEKCKVFDDDLMRVIADSILNAHGYGR